MQHHGRVAEAAQAYGVSKSTIRRWTKSGKVRFFLSPTGQRHVELPGGNIGVGEAGPREHIVIYSRVSSSKQRDDLKRQADFLLSAAKDRFPGRESTFTCKSDIASGLNLKRRGLLSILEAVQKGSVQTIVVASRDRLARFGFDLIKWLCDQHGTTIMVVSDDNSTPTEELGKDLLSIVQVYCCKWNGRRRYKRKEEEIGVDTNATKQDDQGIQAAPCPNQGAEAVL
jgi:putative resolvase